MDDVNLCVTRNMASGNFNGMASVFCICRRVTLSMMTGGCELCTDMKGAHGGKHTHERRRKNERRREEEEEEEEERTGGGTTGGTYCQVGPGGVARVAPLSDSTHKREVGKTLAVGIKNQKKGKKRREELKKEKAGDTLNLIFATKDPKQQ